MSRSRKKYLPATGPENITTQPKAGPPEITPVRRPPDDAPGPLGGLPLWGAGVLIVLVMVVVWAVMRTDAVPDQPAPAGPSAVKAPPGKAPPGKDWATLLMEKARKGELGQQWKPEPWAPKTETDRLVDRFVTLKKAGDAKADDLLGGTALIEDEVIDEATLEPRATDTYLRQPFKITAIYRGEPDAVGGQTLTPNRYTLAGQGPVRTPIIRVRDGKGNAGPTSPFITKDAELVVEVRGGKVFGVRSTAGR